MSVADRLGWGPKREEIQIPVGSRTDGKSWEIRVTPPLIIGDYPTLSVLLTQDQYERYLKWKQGMLMQEALPDLPPHTREVLMTGLGNDDFHNMCMDEDEEDDDNDN